MKLHPQLPVAIEWLRQLVAFDTIPTRSNKSLVAHVARRLHEECSIVAAQKPGGEDKMSLLAVVGPAVDGGVVLSGHTDVVDVAGQQWNRPAFELTEQDGRLFGRGSCDMKGFVSCALAMAPVFAAAPLKKPVFLALSRDEEIACRGSEDMLQMLAESGLKPAAALIGEPTRMQIVNGHKNGLTMRTTFGGTAAHSSMPKAGVSAIPYAARFITHLEELESKMRAAADSSSPFEPPYSSINVGTIHGGTALNIFAAHCEIDWHYRGMPQDDVEAFAAGIDAYLNNELLPAMQKSGHPASIINVRTSFYPGLVPEESTALSLAQHLTEKLPSSGEPAGVVSFGTEAGHFQQAGMPAVVVGPGDINQAHKPDEYIEIEQLSQCLYFMDGLCAHLSA